MVEYAAVDTIYLPQLYNLLTNELKMKNRLYWHYEYCTYLIRQTQIVKEIDKEKIWRIKGCSKLESRQLQGLKTIWHWRNKTAKEKNWPPFKIMNAESMLILAKSLPEIIDKKINFKKLHLKTHASLKQGLLYHLTEGMSVSADQWPDKKTPGRTRSKPKNPQLVESMKKIRDKIAGQLGLTPSLIINKESLIAIAETGVRERNEMEQSANLMKWQKDLLFDAWLEIPN